MQPTTVVYLGGFGRSGSTLVERVLGAAAGWVNVGELIELSRSVARADELCGCGLPFSRCLLWTEVGQAAFGGWTDEVLDRLTALQRMVARQRHLPQLLRSRRPASAALQELRASYARIYRAVAEVTDSCVVVDASKGPALGLALAGAPDIDLRMLNIVRDPRAVAWSWRRHVDRPHVRFDTEEMWRIPVSRSAAQWAALQLEVEAIAAVAGVRHGRLHYEDFVADPVGSLVAATARIDMPLSASELPQVDDGRIVLGRSHGLAGNPSRFQSGAIALRADDAWTAEMTRTDRAMVTAITWPLLVAYGYPTTAGSSAAPVRLAPTTTGAHA
jgi:hypothetical protein